MKKQRSKSQRARRNERRRYKKIIRLFARVAIAADMTAFQLRVFQQRFIIGFDGARPSSYLIYDTKLGKIVDMNTTTKANDE